MKIQITFLLLTFIATKTFAATINTTRGMFTFESRSISTSRELVNDKTITYIISGITNETTAPNGASLNLYDANGNNLKKGSVPSLLIKFTYNDSTDIGAMMKQQLEACYQASLLTPAPDAKVRYFKMTIYGNPLAPFPVQTFSDGGVSAVFDLNKNKILGLSCGR